MFGSSHFGSNIYGQDEFDHDLIVPPWKIQCPEDSEWFPIRQHNTTVERCKPITEEDDEVEFPPINPPPS